MNPANTVQTAVSIIAVRGPLFGTNLLSIASLADRACCCWIARQQDSRHANSVVIDLLCRHGRMLSERSFTGIRISVEQWKIGATNVDTQAMAFANLRRDRSEIDRHLVGLVGFK